MKKCFHCKIEKPLEEFSINRRKYQIKADQGRCIGCKQCYLEKSIKDKSVIFYNFEAEKFEIIKFETEQEVINFINKRYENNKRISN